VVVELQGLLLAREREMDSGEGAIAMWEDGLVAFECTQGKVHTECDDNRVRADAIQQDFFAQARVSSSRFKQQTNHNRMLEEYQSLVCL
jgi:hypothetical protein